MPVYTLLGRIAVPCPDIATWLAWLREHAAETRVGLDRVGQLIISSQFIGLVAPGTLDAPALFTTVLSTVGGRPLAVIYSATWDEATRAHGDLRAAACHVEVQRYHN